MLIINKEAFLPHYKYCLFHLYLGDQVAILGRGGHGCHQLPSITLKLRPVVVTVSHMDPHYGLALPCCAPALPLYVEGVEEERNLLGRLVCRGLGKNSSIWKSKIITDTLMFLNTKMG